MEVMVRVTVSSAVYAFYEGAAAQVYDASPESVMSDTLSAYAGMLSDKIARELQQQNKPAGDP